MSTDVSLVANRLFYDFISVWLFDATPSKMMKENVELFACLP
jgi:hypothetical protein